MFYTSVFKDSKILSSSPINARVEINGQNLILFNGGPSFIFNPSVSIFVDCEDQAEVDYYWERLLEGGEESQCGWLKDKFGELIGSPDREKADRALQAMLKMSKIIEADLQKAFDGA